MGYHLSVWGYFYFEKNFCWGKGLAFKEFHTKQRTFLIYICLTSE